MIHVKNKMNIGLDRLVECDSERILERVLQQSVAGELARRRR